MVNMNFNNKNSVQFTKTVQFSTSALNDIELRKKLIMYCVFSIALYGSELRYLENWKLASVVSG